MRGLNIEDCPHRPPCPGCPRYAEPGIAAAAAQGLARIAAAHGLGPVERRGGPALRFRHRARLAIRGRIGSPKIGLFELGTHHVVHTPNCRVHHPLINEVAAQVRGALVETGTGCYSDRHHLGLVRHLQVVVERRSQTAQVVLVANAPEPAPLGACLERIRERLGARLHSLWFNSNERPTNAILGERFDRWCGPPCVVERFGGAEVHYPPGAFGQNNLAMAEALIGELRAELPRGARVVEYYAGVGAIGLSLLDRVESIALNEVSPQSLLGLESGLAGLSAADRARIRILVGPAGEAIDALADADVVVADPPRKGLDPPLRSALVERPPRRLYYASCGLESFAADLAVLTGSGRLRLAALTAFDFFPYTEHVETLARFERA